MKFFEALEELVKLPLGEHAVIQNLPGLDHKTGFIVNYLDFNSAVIATDGPEPGNYSSGWVYACNQKSEYHLPNRSQLSRDCWEIISIALVNQHILENWERCRKAAEKGEGLEDWLKKNPQPTFGKT